MTSRRCTRRCEKRRTKRTEPWHWSARCSPTRWSGSGGRTIPLRAWEDSTRTSGRSGWAKNSFTASREPSTPIPISGRRARGREPPHHTKQKEDSIIPVGDATMLILERMAKGRNGNSLPFLFPGRDGENARTALRNAWAMVSRNAGLSVEYSVKGRRGKPLKRWKPKYRLYDLRHSYASHLVNRGQSLFLVGKLMGHTQAATTMKYAHAADSALRSVTNDFSKVIEMRPPKLA